MKRSTSNSVLLSICIPTYNRANLLKSMLENLIALDVMKKSDEIEIVILDNASPDETETVGRDFATRYSNLVRYYRNDVNIGDANFGKVLSLGRGEFLKLSNDTLLHTEEGLRYTLDLIRRYRKTKPILCLRCTSTGNPEQHFTTLDSFWKARSYFCTWIAEFGVWKSDFTTAEDFARATETHLTQVDFQLRLMMRKKDAVIVEGIFFKGIPRKKMGAECVNSARVFGVDYIDLLLPYVKTGYLSSSTLNQEKWRVFRYMILPNVLITRPTFMFPKSGFVKHLFKHYKFKCYFWGSIPFVLLARPIAWARKIINV